MRITKTIARSLLLMPLMLLSSGSILAQSSSSNYSLSEAVIGSGGQLDASSSSFQAKASLGDLGVGNSSSSAFQIFAGFTTTDQPYLEFYVDSTDVNLGTLDDANTFYGTTNFYVRSYLTSGYVVTVNGPGLQNENANFIDSLSTSSAPAIGTEQFGLNLVSNTLPAVVGANPVQVPDATFSYGEAAPNYDTADQYRYVDGDTIARSNRSTGQTNYTATYIANVSPATEAGYYSAEQIYIATSTF